MKKLLTLACTFAMIFSLAGCHDAKANLDSSIAKEQYFSVNGAITTKGDVFEAMKSTAGSDALISLVSDKLYEAEGISLTDELKQEGKESVEAMKEGYESEEQFLSILKMYYGYETVDQYLEEMVYPSMLSEELLKKYVGENEESLFEKYKPRKAVVFEFETKEKAEKGLAAIKDDKKNEDVVKDYGTTSFTYDGSESVYISESSIAKAALDEIYAASANGLVDKVIENTTTSTDSTTGAETSKTLYYVVNVIEVDASKMKDDAISAIANQVSTISTSALEYFLKEHNFEIFDIDLYNAIKASNPTYIVNEK